MFIIHVVRQFHPGVGGLENHVLDLVRAQAAAGHRIRVVTLDRLFRSADRKALPGIENLDGVEIVRIPYFGSSRYPIAVSVLRHLREAELVHVHAIDFFFDFLAWTAPIHRRKLVATTHGAFFHTPYAARLKRLWFSTVTKLSSKFYAAVIACSVSDFERFRSICPERTALIEDGVDTSRFRDASAPEFRKSIISFGRFARNKRIDRLIGFMQALTRSDPEWRLTIAGRPDDLQMRDVKALVEKAGLTGMVDVLDSPADATLKTLMRDSSFLAAASDFEGFGMTPVEGMSAGLFPLLSEIPPFRRLVGRTGQGMCLDYSDPDQAARSLLQSLPAISSGYAAQRTACMQAAAAYDWDHVSQKVARLCRAAAETAPRTTLDIPVEFLSLDESMGQGQVPVGEH